MIKTELENTPPAELLKFCMRLVRFKKENKELLTYLLFEAGNEQEYVKSVNEMLGELFLTVNKKNVFFAKKTFENCKDCQPLY
ncbi:MAG: hypothetical protein WKF88_04555 [Ferruginibacter sp.]